MNVPISQRAGKLPMGYEPAPANYQKLLLQRMELYLSGDRVLPGSSDLTTAPTRNIGAWFNPSTSSWWVWDDNIGEYSPVEIGLISGNFGTTINAAPTANRTLTLADKTGTVATVMDAMVPRDAVVLAGTTPTIDASLSHDFYLELSGNTTIQPLDNMPAGGKIKISLVNIGTSYTVTWPSGGADTIFWPAGSAPTQPTATPGERALGIYTIREIDTNLYGEAEVTGFEAPAEPESGDIADIDEVSYGGEPTPPPKGRNPYDRP